MCMLAGWFRPEFAPTVDRTRLLKHLIRKAQAGGDKSFGIFYLKDGKPKLERYVGPASQWLAQNEKELATIAKSPVVLAHTRMPTQGAVTKQNCHPFRIGEWLAAHNGCISNSKELMLKARYTPAGETDSEEALVYIVSEKFSLESMGKITGSYAFEAIKADGSEAVLAVNSVARLHATQVGNGWVWTTSLDSLTSSLAAAGYEPKKVYDMSGFKLHMPSNVIEDMPTQTYAYSGYQGGGYQGWRGGSSYTPATKPEDDGPSYTTPTTPANTANAEEVEAEAWLREDDRRFAEMNGMGGRRLWPGADDSVDEPTSDVPPADLAKQLGLPIKTEDVVD